LLPLQDLETGDLAWMDLSSRSSMARWVARDRDSVKRRVAVLKKAGVDVLRISPHEDPSLRLMGFFAGRRKR
ncbi:MAG: hypothetical protein WCH11_07980, partial [Bdellovibrio sp.]